MSQAELARRSGLNYQQIGRYEKGSERPSIQSLSALLDGLGFDVYDLANALDQVNDRRATKLPGNPRPAWVAALTQRGLTPDALWGFAMGAFDRGDTAAEADFVASASEAARQLAERAIADAREGLSNVAEQPSDYDQKAKPRRRR